MINTYNKYMKDNNLTDFNLTTKEIEVPNPENNILGKFIDYLNQSTFAKNHFSFLDYLSIDFGHLIVFFLIFMTTTLFILVINNKFLKRMEKSIEKRIKDKTDMEIIMKSFISIKKPVAFIFILTGIHSAFFTIYYPHTIPVNAYSIFEFLYTVLTVWISIICVDIFFFAFFEKKDDISMRKEILNLFIKFVKFSIFISGFLFYLTKLGVSLGGILASLGILGMAFALAAKDSLANFFGSLNILLDNSISNGDHIQSKDIDGTVVELGARSTKIRTAENALVTVPNSLLASNPIINWNKRKIGRLIKIKIGISFKSKPEIIEKTLEQLRIMVNETNGVAKENYLLEEDDSFNNKLISLEDMIGVKNKNQVFLDVPGEVSLNIIISVYSESIEADEWISLKEKLTLSALKIINKNKLEIVKTIEDK